ncbi:hypothetical protein M1116_01995 [Patescibacteria group bacterium]|nr:hypothetical protein [Patescibacteria group bacterium]
MKKILPVLLLPLLALVIRFPVLADSLSVNFEPPTYTTGSVNGQDGWTSLGSVGSGCAVYDHAVDSSLSTVGFQTQSLRISNAVTSGCFGDQTFAKPLLNAVGESSATAGSFSVGTLQNHFEMAFDLASAVPDAQQTGLHASLSPDRGDGSRMSYLRFEDNAGGIDVFFDDVQGTANPANFVETNIATLDRSVPHHFQLTMDTLDGPSNDVVKVWIDGILKITGTSWENYYRYDSEAASEQSPRIVKTVLFRTSGDAAPATSGHGFLFDNLSLTSETPTPVSVPIITFPVNGTTLTTAALTKVDWTDSTGTFSPFTYQYEAYSDSTYTNLVYQSGWLTSSEIPTPGTPEGTYYVRVRAQDAENNFSDWSNGSGSPYYFVVSNIAPPVGPPTGMDQCKNSGWQSFNNPTFKNQGDCVSYVQSSPKASGNKNK